MAENIETRISSEQAKEAIYQAHLSKDAIAKIEGLQSSASEIDAMVTNGATQADLDALALSTGNLTASQVATIDNLSGLTSDATSIDGSVSNATKAVGYTENRVSSTTPTALTNSANANWIWIDADAVTNNGYVNTIQLYASLAGKVEISVWNKVGTVYTREKYITLTLVVGLNTFTLTDFDELTVTAGQYIGVKALATGILSWVSDGASPIYLITTGLSTVTSPSTQLYRVSCKIDIVSKDETISSSKVLNHIDRKVDLLKTKTTTLESNSVKVVGYEFVKFNISTPISLANPTQTNATWLDITPTTQEGYLYSFEIYAMKAGQIEIARWSFDGTTYTRQNFVLVSVVAGLNTITYDDLDTFYFAKNSYVGVKDVAGGVIGFVADLTKSFYLITNNATSYTENITRNYSPSIRVIIVGKDETLASTKELKVLQSKNDKVISRVLELETFKSVVPNEYIFCLALGQSNCVGRAPTYSSYTFTEGQAYKYVYDLTLDSGGLQVLADPSSGTESSKGGSFGPAFANEIRLLSRGKIGLIICNIAANGVPISFWNSTTGAERIQKHLTNTLIDAKNKKLNIVGCCAYWLQGEANALSDGQLLSTAAYKAELVNFKTLVDAELGDRVPFLITRVGTKSTGDSGTFFQDIRIAQDEFVEENENCYMVHTGTKYFNERGLMIDDWHYNIQGYNEIGEAAGQSAIRLALGHRPKGYEG